jgi:predicted DNA-binding transcriptional regulator YafY
MSSHYTEPIAEKIDAGLIRQALREQRKLQLLYGNAEGETTNRVIWPLALGYLEDRRILIAWCELRNDYRHFRTDRISEVNVLPARLPEHRDRLLKRWLSVQKAQREAEGEKSGSNSSGGGKA